MTVTITAPGIYDLPESDYHLHHGEITPAPSLSSSEAKKLAGPLATCPARMWYERQNPDTGTTPAMLFGTLVHEILLQGGPVTVSVMPEDLSAMSGNTKVVKEWKAEQINAGRDVVKYGDYLAAQNIVDALNEVPICKALFSNGKPEQSLFWQDPETGVWCRVRLDWLPAQGPFYSDLKSAASIGEDDVRKAMFNFGYFQQAAWYMDGIKALGLCDNPAFLFVFAEKEMPYLTRVIQPTPTAVEWGRILNRKALRTFADCLAADKWPGYSMEVDAMDLPYWGERTLERQHEAGAFDTAIAFQAPHAA